jgi:hypothetical protein
MRFIGFPIICALLAARLAPAQAPPAPEAQQHVLQSVTDFARGYQERLPNFTCIRTTKHLVAPATTRTWHTEATTAYELSYYERDEHYKLISVDGVPRTKVPGKSKSEGWIESSGNFGGILGQLFDPKVHPHFAWHGWDSAHGSRAMVFAFRVALAESHAVSTTCSTWIVFSTCKEKVFAFRGLLFVDAESLDILRITQIPEDIPAGYLQGDTSVDYGRVTVAGGDYLLPTADTLESNAGKTLFRNDSTYADYRKFVAESTLKIEEPEQ